MTALLVRIAGERDPAAFRALFLHYAPRVKGLMLRKGMSPDLAEELMQETMLAVWTKAALYRPSRGSAATWIFTIARNLRIDRLRRESVRHFEDIDEMDLAETDVTAGGEVVTQDAAVIARQERERLSRAMRHLPHEQAEIIRLSFVAELSQREIAGRLDVPLGTVKSRMRLAYRKLRAVLEDEL